MKMIKTMANQRKVKVFDKNGTVIGVFSSLKACANAVNLPSSNISACCKQRLFRVGGLRFAYASDDEQLMDINIPHATNIEFDTPRLPLTYKFIISHHKRAVEAVAWARNKYSDLDDVLTALTGIDVEVTGYEDITVAFVSGFKFTMPCGELTDEFLLKLCRLILACAQLSEDAGDWYRGIYDGEHIVVEKNV
jgi:hypothetical protein